jgi:hypothetical protein
MRRFLLVLTVISFAGWSQPAQQQAQAPIVVQESVAALKAWDNWKDTAELCQHDGDEEAAIQARQEQKKTWNDFMLRRSELEEAIAAACLAVSDDLWKSALAVSTSVLQINQLHFMPSSRHNKTLQEVDEEVLAFTKAARKELGIVHIDA